MGGGIFCNKLKNQKSFNSYNSFSYKLPIVMNSGICFFLRVSSLRLFISFVHRLCYLVQREM